MITLAKTLANSKQELLTYFRSRIGESLEEIRRSYAAKQYKDQATATNKAVIEAKNTLIKALIQKASIERWNNEEILRVVLMITYTSYVVMLDARNDVWPYDFMSFSRRIGELWEPFCKLCFEFPLSGATLFIPPLFSHVKEKLTNEINSYIDQLEITEQQKKELKTYYNKIWGLVTSGEIQLELDLHFELNARKYVVDFKSGFGSNEKGNTNRLLLVATAYAILEEGYNCLILVRAEEDKNNNYFRTLKNSGIWSAYCGEEAYARIEEFSGFPLRKWIISNVDWKDDLLPATITHLGKNNLDQYLVW